MEWFRWNDMKPNEEKCHLFVVNKSLDLTVHLRDKEIKSSKTVDLLGIKIDNKLNFSEHVTKLCKKGNQKLHALARISKYIDKQKLKILMNTFITSHFNYNPLVWMFHNRTINNKINRLHERALRIVYDNEKLSFQELLDLDGAVTIHHKNLQKLATEMYKIKNNLSPSPMNNLFQICDNKYNLRNKRCWEPRNVKSSIYGSETVSFRGPKTWDMLPTNIKEAKSLDEFKARVKHWVPNNCTCRICRTYIAALGFID